MGIGPLILRQRLVLLLDLLHRSRPESRESRDLFALFVITHVTLRTPSQDLNDYLPQTLSTVTQMTIYETSLPPVDLQGLQLNATFICNPSLTHVS